MKKTLLYVAGFGILGYALYRYFTTQANLLQDFTYKIVGFKLRKLNKGLVSLDVTIRFSSKATIDAKVKKIFLDVNIEDKNIGFIQEVREFVIPANGESDIPITFTFNPQLILKNLVDILIGASAKKDVKLSLKGSATIQSGLLSTNLPIKYETSIKQYMGLLR